MAGGGGITFDLGLGAITSFVRTAASGDLSFANPLQRAWRPVQWSQPAMYMITVPGPYTPVLGKQFATPGGETLPSQNGTFTIRGTGAAANIVPANTQPTFLVFDGVLRASHSQPARPTQYPVQTQANFTDHVCLEPARITLDIVMSDAQQAYKIGQWVGNPSKSISCFQVLDTLRAARVPLTVSTRLKTYTSMILVDIIPEESAKTLHGLRARLEFQQVFIATVSVTQTPGTSARQQTTDDTQLGPTNTTPVPAGVVSQNALPSTATGIASSDELQQQLGAVNGAGNWSSNNTSTLPLDFGGGS